MTENKKKLRNIKQKEEQRKKIHKQTVEKEKTIIDTQINKFIEEAKEIGKNEAKEEIKKLEIETNKQIEEEEKKNEEEQKALEVEYKEKEIKVNEKTDIIIQELIDKINKELEEHRRKK